MARWGDDAEFCRAADWSTDVSHEDRLRFFSRLIQSPPRDLIRLAAVHDGTVVGYVDLRGTDSAERELGFVIGHRGSWGKGLGRSAAAAGCAYGFDVLGLRSIRAEALAENVGSVRVLHALGMHETSGHQPAGPDDEHTRRRRFHITAGAWYAGR